MIEIKIFLSFEKYFIKKFMEQSGYLTMKISEADIKKKCKIKKMQ